MTDARRVEAYERFAGPGRGQLQLDELERRPRVLEDRRACPQGAPPPGGSAPASSSDGESPFWRAGGAVFCISRRASSE